MDRKIAYILGSFPEGCGSFVFNEIKYLDRLGFDILIFSIHKKADKDNKNNKWLSRTIYADPFWSPKIILSHSWFILFKPRTYFTLLSKYKSFHGKKVFWESAYFARVIIRFKIRHIHAHFAWVAADAARLISKLTDIPYSLTAHQSDIHRFPVRLHEKLADAKFIITCTKGNKQYLGERYGKEIYKKSYCIYHGVPIEKLSPLANNDDHQIDILSIGNLIKVKGFDYLIRACSILKSCDSFNKCIIVGDGEEKSNLQGLIQELGLIDSVEIWDAVPYEKVVGLYAKARIFVLPIVVIDGAPHGIPNVIAEAMSMGLPVVVSDIPQIPELIEDGKDGILIREKDPKAIADAVEELLNDSEKRTAIGKMAREKILKEFDAKEHIRRFAEFFGSND